MDVKHPLACSAAVDHVLGEASRGLKTKDGEGDEEGKAAADFLREALAGSAAGPLPGHAASLGAALDHPQAGLREAALRELRNSGAASKVMSGGARKSSNAPPAPGIISGALLRRVTADVPRLASLADRTHAMLAEYPGRGSRFVRHVDNTGRDGRRLTVLCYLNPDYVGEHGGALKVYPADDVDGERGEAVAPAGGKIAMFYADQIPHEVLPSHRERHSFTVWYYDEAEHREATARQGDVAAADSRAAHVPVANLGEGDEHIRRRDLADARASAFVKTMMTENLTAEKATAAARALGPSALKTAATVFGAPDETAFVASLERMSPEDFSQLRAEMASMGMENAPDAEWAE